MRLSFSPEIIFLQAFLPSRVLKIILVERILFVFFLGVGLKILKFWMGLDWVIWIFWDCDFCELEKSLEKCFWSSVIALFCLLHLLKKLLASKMLDNLLPILLLFQVFLCLESQNREKEFLFLLFFYLRCLSKVYNIKALLPIAIYLLDLDR